PRYRLSQPLQRSRHVARHVVELSGIPRRFSGLGADELPGALPPLRFKTRDLAIAAYDRADANIRNTLDTLAVTMTIVLEATRAAMDDVDRRPETVAALAGNAIGRPKPLIARAGAIINGESVGEVAPTPQDVVDRLMKR
ncbi:MAG: hypothetical protein WCB55_17505, partial [Pseudolabrys sp.]